MKSRVLILGMIGLVIVCSFISPVQGSSVHVATNSLEVDNVGKLRSNLKEIKEEFDVFKNIAKNERD